ncbi:hypothetical protein AB4Z21_38780, partial [Paenibacillus sp. MCAF20]
IYRDDRTYFDDFWTVPGYLGADPNGSASRDRLHFKSVISEVVRPAVQEDPAIDAEVKTGVDEAWKSKLGNAESKPTLQLESAPVGDLYLDGAYVIFISGEAAGQKVPLGQINGNSVTIG